MKIGFLIQARTNSTRLPEKILKPFYKKDNILDIVIKKIEKCNLNHDIIIATTNNKNDDIIEATYKKRGIKVFRGSESNVLQRFIDAADEYNLSHIVRVCSDNPFLSSEHIIYLVDQIKNNIAIDYLSFKLKNELPVIKSHLGLFVEIVTLSALKSIQKLKIESVYQEHLTLYLYTFPEKFNVKLIELPPYISTRFDLRFTIDNEIDFNSLKSLYEETISVTNLEDFISFVDSKKFIIEIMKKQIDLYNNK